MSLKSTIGSGIRAVARLPLFAAVLNQPSVRKKLQGVPGAWILYGTRWDDKHPFDVASGTETSGFVPGKELPRSAYSTEHITNYAGSQPSIIRAALRELPPLQSFTFVDLGCGKGRPVMVASEFPFKAALGVKLAPDLAACGSQNLEIFRARFPSSCPSRIETGDAVAYAFPSGDLVVSSTIHSGPN